MRRVSVLNTDPRNVYSYWHIYSIKRLVAALLRHKQIIKFCDIAPSRMKTGMPKLLLHSSLSFVVYFFFPLKTNNKHDLSMLKNTEAIFWVERSLHARGTNSKIDIKQFYCRRLVLPQIKLVNRSDPLSVRANFYVVMVLDG